jgi:hypothetical protein
VDAINGSPRKQRGVFLKQTPVVPFVVLQSQVRKALKTAQFKGGAFRKRQCGIALDIPLFILTPKPGLDSPLLFLTEAGA